MSVDILRVAEKFAPEVVYLELRNVTAERDRLRRALDAAMQYVDPKDREWIEGLVRDRRPASNGGTDG